MDFGPTALVVAFAAGFVSFASPCVLPLVPGYLSYVAGIGLEDLDAQPGRVVRATAAFVTGFAAVFVALGAGTGWLGEFLLTNRRTLEIAAGIFIVLAGLVYIGAPLPLAMLRERRLRLRPRDGLVGAGLTGAAFGIGWTPCVGPTLAAILALAASEGGAARGAVLLAVYALGLGVPFLLAGLAFTRTLAVVHAVGRHRRMVGAISGGLLVVFGVLLATGELVRLTTRLARFTGLSI
jgi:cytochrome c-type biogenesis protein